ncbi:MAG: hypothetical protein GXP29_01395 [Planctomycetes bacterium]|nr:hypothetical protein [Planctomycetota bacterium]
MEPEFVHPQHSTREIARRYERLQQKDWDDLVISFALEDEFGDALRDSPHRWPTFIPWKFFWWRSGTEDFGGWLKQTVEVILLELRDEADTNKIDICKDSNN